MSGDRVISHARLSWGVALLAAPRRVMGYVPAANIDSRAVAYARVLGARQIAEEVVLHRHPGPRWRWAGAAIDALHGMSTVALMRRAPRRRSLLAANALSALVLSLGGARAALAAHR